MKSVISTTYDDKYLFYLPITVWCWNKLGVEIVCFYPANNLDDKKGTLRLIHKVKNDVGLKFEMYGFKSPEHKEATYAQCSRLYAAALDLPEDEILVTSDCDMLTFGNIWNEIQDGNIHIIGADLLSPEMKQYPLCYLAMPVKAWRDVLEVNGRTVQQCLDETVGKIECENFRGNQWSLDQFTAHQQIEKVKDKYEVRKHMRAKMPERFASNRIDRDDAFWKDRLSHDIIDYHCHRPGYELDNFGKVLTVLEFFYPNNNFDWLIKYHSDYVQLMK